MTAVHFKSPNSPLQTSGTSESTAVDKLRDSGSQSDEGVEAPAQTNQRQPRRSHSAQVLRLENKNNKAKAATERKVKKRKNED